MERQQTEPEDEQWTEIEPLLNRSLAALKASDRDCVLLRFFQGASFAQIGATFDLSEDAARKRVTRSLDKMRHFFTKNGVVVPTTAFAVLLTTHAVRTAPPHIAEATMNLMTATPPGPISLVLKGTLYTMKIANIKAVAGAVSVLIAGFAGVLFVGTTLVARSARKPVLIRIAGVGSAAKIIKPVTGQPHSINPQARRLLAEMTAAYQGISSYSGKTTFLVANGAAGVQALMHHQLKPQVEEDVAIQRPNRVAVRVKGENTYIYGGDGNAEAVAVSNGTDYYETRPSSSQAEDHYLHASGPTDAISEALGVGGMLAANGHLARLLNGQNPVQGIQSLKMGGVGVSDHVPNLIVVAVSQVNDKGVVNNVHIPAVTTETFLIGRKDHLLRRWTATSKFVDPHLITTVATATRTTGGIFWIQSESFQNVKLNPHLPADAFVFTPPPGSTETKVDNPNE